MSGLKLKYVPLFPQRVIGGAGIDVEKANGNWTIALDYGEFGLNSPYVPQPGHRVVLFTEDSNGYVAVPVTTLAPIDTSPPTTPASLAVAVISSSEIDLSWTASTDDVGVTAYLIEQCSGIGCSSFTQIATTTGTTFANTGLIASTSYSYRVRATDASSNLSGYSNTATAVTGAAAGAEAAAFLARTSGLDATHTNAYIALINGLVADGVWSKFDILRIYATQNSTTALLNLVSSSYGGTTHGTAPTLTADRGFTGDGSTSYIDTNFIPPSAPSPNFVLNSAHISTWIVTDGTDAGQSVGDGGAPGGIAHIHPRYIDGNAYFRLNGSAGSGGVAVAAMTGHSIANRPSSSQVLGYRNGSLILTNSDTSTSVPSNQFVDLASNGNVVGNYFSHQVAATSIGSSLSSTDVMNFYNRLRTYMTAVGVP
jgi:hypothetical protein